MPSLTSLALVLAALPDAHHTVWSWALAILGLGFLIFVHEFGHFLACRATGTRVETFSIGFGPRLFGWERFQGRRTFTVGPRRFPASDGAMDVRVAAIPLGGYVKMAGEIGGDGSPGEGGEPRAAKPDEFPQKPFFSRVFIICAGVLMNALAAVVLFAVAYSSGVKEVAPVVGAVTPGKAAWAAGVAAGDRVLSVDGSKVRTFDDLWQGIVFHTSSEPAEVVFRRGSESRTVHLTPEYDEEAGIQRAWLEAAAELKVDDGHGPPLAIGPAERVRVDGRTAVGGLEAVRALDAAFEAGKAEVLVERLDPPPPGEPSTRSVSFARLRVVPAANRTWKLGLVAYAPPVVARVRAPSPAEAAGLRPGDRIVSVVEAQGGEPRPVGAARDLWALGAWSGLVVLRGAGGEGPEKPAAEVSLAAAAPTPDAVRAFLSDVAFAPPQRKSPAVEPRGADFEGGVSPAEEAGILPGDEVVGVGKTRVTTVQEMIDALGTLSARPVTLTVRSPGKESRDVTVTPRPIFDAKAREAFYAAEPARETVVADGVLDAAGMAVAKTGSEVRKIFTLLGGLFGGRISASKAVSGPGTIANVSSRKALEGIPPYLAMLALISVSLAVLNLLPIPILDGGQLLFLVIERLRGGRPLKEATIARLQMIGLILLLALMFFAVKNDIVNLGGK